MTQAHEVSAKIDALIAQLRGGNLSVLHEVETLVTELAQVSEHGQVTAAQKAELRCIAERLMRHLTAAQHGISRAKARVSAAGSGQSQLGYTAQGAPIARATSGALNQNSFA
ncbi:MAG: hypothetical protein AAFQ36_02815 [Pseudomonadota bacterium]